MPQNKYIKMCRACRAHVENKFTLSRMILECERIYRQVRFDMI